MAKEFDIVTLADKTIYVLLKNPQGKFWNGSIFEDYVTANRGNYNIGLIEQGTSSGIYLGDFPTAVTSPGTYGYYAYVQSGGSPSESDKLVGTGNVDWTGTVSSTTTTSAQGPLDSMSAADFRNYVIRRGFKRTDKDTELYEATTDMIQELRRKFNFNEAETEKVSTDTISVLGDFRIDLESDNGLLLSVVVEDGTDAEVLKKVSKWEFDNLYPDINVTSDRGFPEHYAVYGNQIYIGPKPDQTSYVYRINYSKRSGTVTSATSLLPFTNIYRDILADGVLARLWELMDQFDRANYFYQRFEIGIQKMIRKEEYERGEAYFQMRSDTTWSC